MLKHYPRAFGVATTAQTLPTDAKVRAVLGESHHDANQYTDDEKKLFAPYFERFKLGSKPAAHLAALAHIKDDDLVANMPATLGRLVDAIGVKLAEIPE